MDFKAFFIKHFTFYKIGFALAIVGLLQFLVFMALDMLNLIDVGNGLGPGLVMAMFYSLGGFCFICGLFIDLVRWLKIRLEK